MAHPFDWPMLAWLVKIMNVIINILKGQDCEPAKPKPIMLVFATGHDEPIPKETPMEVTLSKPIKPGFRRAFTVGTDEPVDQQPNGAYASSEVLEGDSTAAVIKPESTATLIQGWIYGDGSLGTKKTRITVDGHVGAGEASITLDILYTVSSPDATDFVNFTEGADEAIPAPVARKV